MVNNFVLTILFAVALLFPTFVYANAGLPMLTINLPILVVCLLPVIGIESIVLSFQIDISFARILRVVGISNVISTCVGLPVVWAILVMFQLGSSWLGFQLKINLFYFGSKTFWQQTFTTIGFFPWIYPFDWISNYHITLAAVILHVAFFFASFWLERSLIQKQLPELDKDSISKGVLFGNITTYLILIPTTIYIMQLPLDYKNELSTMFREPTFLLWLITLPLLFFWGLLILSKGKTDNS